MANRRKFYSTKTLKKHVYTVKVWDSNNDRAIERTIIRFYPMSEKELKEVVKVDKQFFGFRFMWLVKEEVISVTKKFLIQDFLSLLPFYDEEEEEQ